MDGIVKYWPFEVLPKDRQTEEHRREIRFFEELRGLGFTGFLLETGNIGSQGPNGRVGRMIRRGRGRWEVWLEFPGQFTEAAFYSDYALAGEAIRRWLQGEGAAAALERGCTRPL